HCAGTRGELRRSHLRHPVARPGGVRVPRGHPAVPAHRSARRVAGKDPGMSVMSRLPRPSWSAPRLPRGTRVAIWIVVIALAFLLPYIGHIPVLGSVVKTTGIDWPSALFNMSYYVLLALRLNVVVGFARLLDLGY